MNGWLVGERGGREMIEEGRENFKWNTFITIHLLEKNFHPRQRTFSLECQENGEISQQNCWKISLYCRLCCTSFDQGRRRRRLTFASDKVVKIMKDVAVSSASLSMKSSKQNSLSLKVDGEREEVDGERS